jgi:hypothetical protein
VNSQRDGHTITFESDHGNFPGSPYAAVVLDGERVGTVKYVGQVALTQCYFAMRSEHARHEQPLLFDGEDALRAHVLAHLEPEG